MNCFQVLLSKSTCADTEWENFGDTVHDVLSGGVSDIDGGSELRGVAVIHADQRGGHWEWSEDGGIRWYPFVEPGAPDISPEKPLLIKSGALDRVKFRPNRMINLPIEDVYGSASFAFRAWDTSSGHATGSRGRYEQVAGAAANGSNNITTTISTTSSSSNSSSGAATTTVTTMTTTSGTTTTTTTSSSSSSSLGLDGIIDGVDGVDSFYGLDGATGHLDTQAGATTTTTTTANGITTTTTTTTTITTTSISLGQDGGVNGTGEFYGLYDGLEDASDGGFDGGALVVPQLTWVWFNASAYTADGSISLRIGTAVVSVYGLEWSGYMRDNMVNTLKERARVKAVTSCPPPHGSAVRP